ncbi:tetratricopeptide repeat protein [Geodermatophilus sp. SYSU D00696]
MGDAGGVFVSWTRRDEQEGTDRLAEMRELVELLWECKVPVWLDDAEIGPFDPIPERVRAGLSDSRVILAWYSAAYPTRRACREELTLALLAAERAGQGSGRVLVVNPEPGMDHVLEARLLDRRFAGPDDLGDLPALAARIAERVAQHSTPFGDLPAPGRPRWYGGAGWEGGSHRFVGRLGQLWAVHDRLHRTTGLVGPGTAGRAVAVVSGFGGMGKSLLAVEYAHLFADCYPGGVVWLSAAGNDPTGTPPTPEQTQAAADSAFTQLATDLDLDVAHLEPDRVRERVKTALDERGQPVLWIADDLPTGLDAAGLDAWRCPAAVVHEIVTTRDRAHTRRDAVDLDVLSEPDALALLTQGRPLPDDEREQARLLAEDLGWHPLACDVAGLYIAGATTFTAYRELINGSLAEFDELAADLADQLPGDHARQITATLATSLRRLGDDAWTLLRLAGQLAPTAIPRQLVVDVFRQRTVSNGKANRLVNRALHDPHRDGLYSAVQTTQTVLVHVLVRAAATFLDPHSDDQARIRAAAVTALNDRFGDAAADVRRHSALTDLAPHARHLTSAPRLDTGQDLALLDCLARYDGAAGRPAVAAEELKRALTDRERLLGSGHPDTVSSRGNLAYAYAEAGWVDRAVPLHELTLADCLQLLGPNHPNTLTSRNNLANAYCSAGRFDEALAEHRRTLTDREQVLGPDHPDTLKSRGNLANGYLQSGHPHQALPLYEGIRADLERLLGPEHPDTLKLHNNLATAYSRVSRLAEAVTLHERTLAARERILGPDHPDTLESRHNLANAYLQGDCPHQALPLYEGIRADFERLLGPEHPDTLKLHNNLATAYDRVSRLAEAVTLHERTLAARERILGPDHPDTLSSRHNLATTYRKAERSGEAVSLHEQTLAARERLSGPDHPDTLTSCNNLANAYFSAGRPDAAMTLHERTLAARERVLGPYHPDTWSSRENLAIIRRSSPFQGKRRPRWIPSWWRKR